MEIFVIFSLLVLSHGFAGAQNDKEVENLLLKDSSKVRGDELRLTDETEKRNPDENKEGKGKDKKEEGFRLGKKAEKEDADEEAKKIRAELKHDEALQKEEIAENAEEAELGKEAAETKPGKKKEGYKSRHKQLGDETKNGKKKDEDLSEADKILVEEMHRIRGKELEEAEAAREMKSNRTEQNKTKDESNSSEQNKTKDESKIQDTAKAEKQLQLSEPQKSIQYQGAIQPQNDSQPYGGLDPQMLIKESKSVRDCIVNELPLELRIKVEVTDKAENAVLGYYVASKTVPGHILHKYTAAKGDERELLKEFLPDLGSEADNVLAAYRALRNGEAWNYIQLDVEFEEFFRQPSSFLTQYETLKADEKNSLDSVLKSPTVVQNAKAQAVVVNNRASIVEASENQHDLIERRVRAVGVEAFENDEATERGNGEIDTTEKASEILEDDLGETSSEEVTTKIAEMQIINEEDRSLVNFVILCSLIVVLTVIFVIVIACRKQITKCCMKHKRIHPGKNTEPSPADDNRETEATETSAHYSISVTTVERTDHP